MTLGVSALGEVNLDRSHLAWVAARGRDTGSFGQTGAFEPKLCHPETGESRLGERPLSLPGPLWVPAFVPGE